MVHTKAVETTIVLFKDFLALAYVPYDLAHSAVAMLLAVNTLLNMLFRSNWTRYIVWEHSLTCSSDTGGV